MERKKQGSLITYGTRLVIFVFFFFTVIVPILTNLQHVKKEQIIDVFTMTLFREAFINSIMISAWSALLAVVGALGLALLVERLEDKYKNIFKILFTIPLLVPSISHGLALIGVLGDSGVISSRLNIEIELYGVLGMTLGYLMYSLPIGFLVILDRINYRDHTTYEAAKVLGINPVRRFFDITLPQIKKNLISVYFMLFIMIFADYGIPLAVGGKVPTLAVFLYREVVGLLEFSKGAIIAIVLLIPAAISFWIDMKMRTYPPLDSIATHSIGNRSRKSTVIILVICTLSASLIILPLCIYGLTGFIENTPYGIQLTIEHLRYVLELGIEKYLWNSLVIALSTGVFGTILASSIAYFVQSQSEGVFKRVYHFLALLPMMIPGIVLGLGYIQTFGGSFLYGTVTILILVNTVHFFSTPYMLVYHALDNIGGELEEVARTLGIPKWRIIKDIIIPNIYGTLIEVFTYFVINSMTTISAISFLYNTENMPIAIMINELEGQLLMEATAVVSMIILILNVALRMLIYGYKKFIRREEQYARTECV